jgi:hypothetical protein
MQNCKNRMTKIVIRAKLNTYLLKLLSKRITIFLTLYNLIMDLVIFFS